MGAADSVWVEDFENFKAEFTVAEKEKVLRRLLHSKEVGQRQTYCLRLSAAELVLVQISLHSCYFGPYQLDRHYHYHLLTVQMDCGSRLH